MPFTIIRNDITKVRADAIVNTANPNPTYGSGTDAAIYRAAGEEDLLAERRKIGRLSPGETAVTKAFRLNAKFIIHTVGPVWVDGKHREYELLASCYRKSLQMALHLGCASIAFPLISTGSYGFPKDKALDIALKQISAFLEDAEMDVTLVVFDRRTFNLSAELKEDVSQFIDENYVEDQLREEYGHGYSNGRIPERRDFLPRNAQARRRADYSRYEEERNAETAGPLSEEKKESRAGRLFSKLTGRRRSKDREKIPDSARRRSKDREERPGSEVWFADSREKRPGSEGQFAEHPFNMGMMPDGTGGLPESYLGESPEEYSFSLPDESASLTYARDTSVLKAEEEETYFSAAPGQGTAIAETENRETSNLGPSNQDTFVLRAEEEEAYFSEADAGDSLSSEEPKDSREKRREDEYDPLSGEREKIPSSSGAAFLKTSSPREEIRIESTYSPHRRSLQDVMSHMGESFQECLLRMIDERGLTDSEVYKRANIDRKLFSKIRCNPSYNPSRRTVMAFVIALRLNMDEAVDLLRKAGMALSPGSKFDLIITYCIQNRIYDIFKINALLFDYDQPTLGAG